MKDRKQIRKMKDTNADKKKRRRENERKNRREKK